MHGETRSPEAGGEGTRHAGRGGHRGPVAAGPGEEYSPPDREISPVRKAPRATRSGRGGEPGHHHRPREECPLLQTMPQQFDITSDREMGDKGLSASVMGPSALRGGKQASRRHASKGNASGASSGSPTRMGPYDRGLWTDAYLEGGFLSTRREEEEDPEGSTIPVPQEAPLSPTQLLHGKEAAQEGEGAEGGDTESDSDNEAADDDEGGEAAPVLREDQGEREGVEEGDDDVEAVPKEAPAAWEAMEEGDREAGVREEEDSGKLQAPLDGAEGWWEDAQGDRGFEEAWRYGSQARRGEEDDNQESSGGEEEDQHEEG